MKYLPWILFVGAAGFGVMSFLSAQKKEKIIKGALANSGNLARTDLRTLSVEGVLDRFKQSSLNGYVDFETYEAAR